MEFDKRSNDLYFYSNACHVCRKYGKNVDLKRCSSCKMIAYCSREHQREHWKAHKDFCKAIAAVEKESGPILDRKKKMMEVSPNVWNRFMDNSIHLVESKLGRKLLQYEEGMFLYARCCHVCYDTDKRRLTDCSNCPGFSVCPDHVNIEHEETCKLTRLCFKLQITEFNLPHVVPMINFGIDIPNDMLGIMKNYYMIYHEKIIKDSKIIPFPLDIWTEYAANGLSRPYSLLHAVRKLSISKCPQNIHILGADKDDFNGIECWEALFHHHQSLQNVEVTLIGPELEDNTYLPYLCVECATKGTRLSIKSIKAFYHDYVVSEKYTKPNFVAGFNIRIYESAFPKDSWLPTIKVIENLGCPVLFTAFCLNESNADRKKINSVLQRDVKFVYSGKNPFSSTMPLRDPGSSAFLYNNQYLTIYEEL